ncbi:hypothetical protein EP18_14930 [Lysinibacillus sphaericus]|nr:hypothetical protein EP18_14930 [Lysinibacillus sphaericus]
MKFLYCFISLFLLNGLIMGSLESDFLTDLFGYLGDNISVLFGLPLLVLIRFYFKEIHILIYIFLWFFSMFSYLVIISIVNPQ